MPRRNWMPRGGTPTTVDGAKWWAENQSEKDFQANIEAAAKRLGWHVYHTHDARRSAAGFPDLVMVRRGRLIFAELKREKGSTTTKAQYEWLRELLKVRDRIATLLSQPSSPPDELTIAHAGRIVGVYRWHPSDWPDVEKVLQ